MRQTNKRHKKQNNIKKRKTLKKRFSKKGGVQKMCGVCGKGFHMLGTIGAPSRSDDPNLYQNHIKTHPKCLYCNGELLDNNTLANHLKTYHPEKYKLAESIKYGINNESNLIDKLRDNVWSEIGSLPELTTFYNKIEEKQKSIERKEAERLAKEEKTRADEAKRLAKETARKEEEARKLSKKAEEESKKETERLAKEAIRERERVAREIAAAKKLEQIKKEQQEKLARELEVKTMGMEDRVAKGIEKKVRKELTAMGAEDILSTEVNQQLIEELNTANTVEDAIKIIESATEPTVSKVDTAPMQNINLISMLSKNEIRTIKNPNFQRNITYGMTSLFPVTKCFSEEINKLTNKKTKYNEYKMINNLILFLVGLFNYKFIQNNIDIRMIIKGGKGAQIILSAYDFYNLSNGEQVKCDITSDDIDILLVQENGYNRENLYSIAKQFANLVENIIDEKDTDNKLISIRQPIPDAFNPNIFKISYINKTEPNKTKYNVVSDIDFKKVESDFFDINNIEGLGFPNEYNPYGLQYSYNNYIFDLRYWLQSPQAFLAEKQHYLSIYENIIQKSSTIKDKICDCNNIIEEGKQGFDYDCYMTCKVREMMIPKFQKYIMPFQQLVDRLSNNSNFAGHYSL